MKLRRLLGTFALIAMFALAGTGIGLLATPVNADEEKTAVEVVDVNWVGWANQIFVGTNVKIEGADVPGDTSHVKATGPDGQSITVQSVTHHENYLFINIGGEPAVGTYITIQAGYSFTDTAEFKEDVSYIYSTAGTPFTPYTPEPEKAAVQIQNMNWSGDWNQILIQTDTYCGSMTHIAGDQEHIEVKNAEGEAVQISSVQHQDHSIFLNIGKEPDVGTVVTIKAGYAFTATAEVKEDVSYIYSTKGQPFTLYTSEPDEPDEPVEKTAVRIENVNYDSTKYGGLGFEQILIQTDTYCGDGFSAGDFAHIEVRDSIGQEVRIEGLQHHDHHLFLNIGKEPEVGTIITIKAGYSYTETTEVKEDVAYIYSEPGHPFIVYTEDYTVEEFSLTNDPEDNIVRVHATKQLTWTMNESAIATPHFTSDQPQIASVDANGVVEGLSVGQATITAQAGTVQATYTVEVQPALETKGVEWGISYKIWVEKGAQTVAIPEDFTAHATFEEEGTGNKLVGSDFAVTAENCTLGAVDTNTAGTSHIKATVTYEGTQYQLDLDVEVYEIVPMEIKEVAVVDWFGYNIFVEFPNSSANNANLTTSSLIPDASKFEYTRADGTVVSAGCYVLGGGNLAVLPSYYSDGVFSSLPESEKAEKYCAAPYMQPGDRLTLKAGLAGYFWTGELAPTPTDNNAIAPGTGMVVRECVLEQDVTYVFDGNLWVVYIPYTDLEVKEELTLQVGESKNLGALRVPNDATEGTLTYQSANEQIAKVSSSGRVTAVAIGETTITVTLSGGVAGDKVKTVKIVVEDGIVSLQFAEGTSLTVKQGTGSLDLSGLTATFVYASGKTETADLSNAEIVGFDMNAVGECEVTVKVVFEGKTYQTQLTVIVEAVDGGGCGSVIGGTLLGVITALGAVALVLKKKKD